MLSPGTIYCVHVSRDSGLYAMPADDVAHLVAIDYLVKNAVLVNDAVPAADYDYR